MAMIQHSSNNHKYCCGTADIYKVLALSLSHALTRMHAHAHTHTQNDIIQQTFIQSSQTLLSYRRLVLKNKDTANIHTVLPDTTMLQQILMQFSHTLLWYSRHGVLTTTAMIKQIFIWSSKTILCYRRYTVVTDTQWYNRYSQSPQTLLWYNRY